MSILEIVKKLLKITDGDQDDIISLYVDMITRQILNYTNRAKLPDELLYIAAQMVVDIYNETTQDGKTGNVSSVSEAGRSVSFNTALVQLAMENKLADRKSQLNGFRQPYRLTDKRE